MNELLIRARQTYHKVLITNGLINSPTARESSKKVWSETLKLDLEYSKKLLVDLEKEYRSLKKEHCDDCEPYNECSTCRVHFDEIREVIYEVKDALAVTDEEVKKDE